MARAGVLFCGTSSGSLSGSAVRDNGFAVTLERGARPTIASDNLFAGNRREGVTVGKGLEPAPPIGSLDLFELPQPTEP